MPRVKQIKPLGQPTSKQRSSFCGFQICWDDSNFNHQRYCLMFLVQFLVQLIRSQTRGVHMSPDVVICWGASSTLPCCGPSACNRPESQNPISISTYHGYSPQGPPDPLPENQGNKIFKSFSFWLLLRGVSTARWQRLSTLLPKSFPNFTMFVN